MGKIGFSYCARAAYDNMLPVHLSEKFKANRYKERKGVVEVVREVQDSSTLILCESRLFSVYKNV